MVKLLSSVVKTGCRRFKILPDMADKITAESHRISSLSNRIFQCRINFRLVARMKKSPHMPDIVGFEVLMPHIDAGLYNVMDYATKQECRPLLVYTH
jgi:hypothetical protein